MKPEGRLSKEAFVAEAFELIAESGGYSELTIDRLCERLKVSKGSFYWHFKGRAGLIDAVLSAWAGRLHENLYSEIESASDGDALKGIQQIFKIWQTSNIARIDQVMRHWASHDERVKEAVSQADHLLFEYLASKLHGLGLEKVEAQRSARILIAVGIAQPQIAHLPMQGSAQEQMRWLLGGILPGVGWEG